MVAVFKRKDLSSLNKFSFPVNGNYTDPFCESSKNLSSFFIQLHLFVANVRPDGKIKVCYTVYSIGGHWLALEERGGEGIETITDKG